MTAPEDDDARDKKRGVETDTVDAETLLKYLEQTGGETINGLANAAGVTEDRIRELIITLKDRGQVRIHPRQHDVLVKPFIGADNPVRADGGILSGLGSGRAGPDHRLEMTERQVYHLLSNERRRMVLRLLDGTYDPDEPQYLETRELAKALASTETSDTSTGDVHRAYVSLTQVHIPLMDSLGVVEHYERVEKICATKDAVVAADLMRDIAEVATEPSQPDLPEEFNNDDA